MDDADRAQCSSEVELANIINNRDICDYNIKGSGLCIICDDIVEPILHNNEFITGRFCSDECRNEDL